MDKQFFFEAINKAIAQIFTKNDKFIIFIMVMFSSSIFSQKYDATLYFKNGSKRIGKADLVVNGEPKLVFVENGSKKKEKIKVFDLQKVEYINPKDGSTLPIELKEFVYYLFSDKPKTDYNWMVKQYSGPISMYYAYSYDGGISDGYHYSVTPSQISTYFFQYKEEKPQIIYFNNNMWTPNKKKLVSRMVVNFFKDKCSKLISDFKNEKLEIKNNNPKILIEYYEKNCL